jgi:hypothetical protein
MSLSFLVGIWGQIKYSGLVSGGFSQYHSINRAMRRFKETHIALGSGAWITVLELISNVRVSVPGEHIIVLSHNCLRNYLVHQATVCSATLSDTVLASSLHLADFFNRC